MNKYLSCEEVFKSVLFSYDERNPIGALSSLLENDTDINEDLKDILLTNQDAITNDYLLNRYERIISPLFVRLMDHYDNDLELTCNDIASIIKTKFLFNWNKLAEAVFSEYNPIDNYNMIENKETDFEEHTVTDNSETVKNKYSGFNSEAMSEVSESESEGNIETTKNDTGSKAKNELTRRGNIGVTTTQMMIQSSFELAKKNLINTIYKDIDTILFIDYYC